ncbi:hypothetical protein Acid345_4262 [Candidatus Koribacter versatilis Ellin345]|uniref:Uncharacterized protein n=1 Tax=Koribacter versatilis (strain Ellin345) TaxID=204669 RepID=Q1IIN8_KORVE|nr:hypothetical protein [Candidatus Koribacter versatilis]ABF43254.1 hypothetical protein Acid345_4254 [Candidatus Koribacter versatilis Ellin345]ABF43262.1 hypothetical protein Acid345_4262 [Candidatus Koribacter versatilis Ellin345]
MVNVSDTLRDYRRCLRKRRYQTREAAEQKARKASTRTGEVIHSYHCGLCGLWHIGKQRPPKGQTIEVPGGRLCWLCGDPIPRERLEKSSHAHPTFTCSPRCSKLRKRFLAKQRRMKKAREDLGPKGSSGTSS